jgi:predicted CxxxxCH...CXXCH cytochrome family protein
MKRILILTGVCCVIALQLVGCKSNLKDTLPTNPELAGVHPAGWVVKGSPDFHGITAAQGTAECKRCHGADLAGGTAKVSCGSVGCHGKGFHPDGYGNPASPNFHRLDLRAKHDDLSSCKGCHNTDYSGSMLSGNVSCNNTACHVAADGGPEACYTCHGEYATKVIYPQGYPAHGTHISGDTTISKLAMVCKDCHNFGGFNDPNHLGGNNPNGAEVSINDSLAKHHTTGSIGTPTYNYTTGACENVYCHGNFTNGNTANAPVWKGTDQAKCGSCHGDPATGDPTPKSPHVPVKNCYICHPGVVDNTGKIIDAAKHVNGKLNKYGTEDPNW